MLFIILFQPNVIVLPEDTKAELTDENEITLTDCTVTLTAGNKFALVKEGFPVVRRAAQVSVEENRTIIQTADVPMEEAFQSYDLQGNMQMDLGQTQSAANNISLDYIVGGTEENRWEDGEKYKDIEQAQGQRINAVEVKAVYDIPREIQKKYDLSDGMEATITCKISDFSSDYNSTWTTAYFGIGAKVDFSCNVSLDVLKDIGVAPSVEPAKIPIGYIGFFKVTLDMVLKGNATLNMVEYISIGVQYSQKNGFRIHNNFYKKSFTIQARAEASVGIKVSAGINCGFIKGEVYGKAGATTRIETEVYTDEKLPASCTHLSAWLYASIGCSVSVDILVYKDSWGKELTIYRADNSPVRVAYHYEDGVAVPSCTRDKAAEESGTGKRRWKYYTPSYSPYGYNGSNAGIDSDGKEYTIFDYSLDKNGNATRL